MSYFDVTSQALMIQVTMFLLSLVGSYIVLVLLKGTAVVKHKGAQFGGAAAMFVAMYWLLNNNFPATHEIISKANAAQQQVITKNEQGSTETLSISLTPDRQKITERDLLRLDKNKYFIHEGLKFAMQRPESGAWSIEEIDKLETLGIEDTPIGRMAMKAMNRITVKDDKTPPKIVSFKSKRVRSIMIDKESEIEGLSYGYNPFGDSRYIYDIMEAQLEAGAVFAPAEFSEIVANKEQRDKLISQMVSAVGDKLKDGFDKHIDKQLPETKKLSSGVYIQRIKPEFGDSVFVQSITKNRSTLDKAYFILNSQISLQSSGRNLKIDQDSATASFSGSIIIRNVTLDGRKTDANINQIGFIVAGDDDIILVRLIAFDIDGLDTALLLKRVMDSLLFVI